MRSLGRLAVATSPAGRTCGAGLVACLLLVAGGAAAQPTEVGQASSLKPQAPAASPPSPPSDAAARAGEPAAASSAEATARADLDDDDDDANDRADDDDDDDDDEPRASPARDHATDPAQVPRWDEPAIGVMTTPHPEDEDRSEVAALPIVAGNSDIGIQFGGAAFITRLARGARPYAWKADVLLSLSLKPGPNGVDVAQQAHDLRLDIPRFLGSRVRVMPGLFVERHVNAGYFGLGNASQAVPFPDGSIGRRYHSVTEEARFRLNARVPLRGSVDAMLGIQLRYTDADAYAYSKLAADAAAIEADGRPRIFGMDPIASAIPAAGLVYDTRDNEVSPRSGAFDIAGMRLGVGVPAGGGTSNRGMGYVGGSVVLRRYVPLPGPFVFAGRVIADVMAGSAPFYDLVQGVTFTPIDLIGGHGGLRGVPNGRYIGKIKALASAEVRAQLVAFGLLKQRFRAGAQAFVDTGRVWNDFRIDPDRDGRGLGLKYGVGGGMYFIWGAAAVIRMELAYSPDAASANPGFPFGFYVADGHAF
ncbi:MAG: BamA/TamA family outer membrane protein [Labilithrix sp.]|nr:BamA/TamA family outer membrane protein [Labilithrix sp.]